MKRWMVSAVVGLAAAGGVVAPGSAQASSSAWYQVYQAGVSGSFSQTAAISKNDIWAVGDTYTRAGKTIYRPFIRHFNGHSWRAITIPHGWGSTADWVSASSARNVWVGGLKKSSVATLDIVPDGKGGYWFGAQAILTANTWTTEQVPGFTGSFGGVTRIPGTTSFLLNAGVEAGGSSTEKPTIFRFDL